MNNNSMEKPIEERIETNSKGLEIITYIFLALGEIALIIFAFTKDFATGMVLCTIGLVLLAIPFIIVYLLFRLIGMFCKMSRNLDILARKSLSDEEQIDEELQELPPRDDVIIPRVRKNRRNIR